MVGCTGVCSPVCVRASLSLFLLSPSLSAPSYLRPSFCARVCQGESGEKGGEGGGEGGGGGRRHRTLSVLASAILAAASLSGVELLLASAIWAAKSLSAVEE